MDWLAIFLMLTAVPANSEEKQPRWVEAAKNELRCFHYQKGWITDTTGPCDDFRPPDTIAIGQTFFANGQAHIISIITATRAPSDATVGEFSIRAGTLYCAAAEHQDDLDFDGRATERTWLFIPSCIIVQ